MARLRDLSEGTNEILSESLSASGRLPSQNASKSRSPSKIGLAAASQQMSQLPNKRRGRPGHSRQLEEGSEMSEKRCGNVSYDAKGNHSTAKTAEKGDVQLSANSSSALPEKASKLSKSLSSHIETSSPSRTRGSPSRKVKENVNYYRYGREGKKPAEASKEEADETDPFTDLSGFIVDDDVELSVESDNWASEEESQRQRQKNKGRGVRLRRTSAKYPKVNVRRQRSISVEQEITSLTSTLKNLDLMSIPKLNLKPVTNPVMSSPTKAKRAGSPGRKPISQGREVSTPEPFGIDQVHEENPTFITPPTSPSKPQLRSPSKSSCQIPQSPHRQSLDLFWSSEATNTWNDQHSPRKTPHTNRKGIQKFLVFSDDDMDLSEGSTSPSPTKSSTASPPKWEPIASPSKLRRGTNRPASERRKAFNKIKQSLAHDLLSALDNNVCQGKLSLATAETGGVKIKWSKTLNKTAGRANWRRTNVGPNTLIRTTFAEIELAEKVIDCPERLVNTLSHEFCHLANYEVSNELADAHGKSWWKWVRRTLDFLQSQRHNPLYIQVEITARHNYKIDYKYVWLCVGSGGDDLMTLTSEGCGMEYGRHSRSIDPARQKCSRCKGSLVQVKPMLKTGKKMTDKLPSSPRKGKNVPQELMEDASTTIGTNIQVKERAKNGIVEVADFDHCTSMVRLGDVEIGMLNSSSIKTQETTIVDLTESSDVGDDNATGDLSDPFTAFEIQPKKKTVPETLDADVVAKEILVLEKMKMETVDVIDLTSE